MEVELRRTFDLVWGSDRKLQNKAFYKILDLLKDPVNWSYEIWEEVIENLSHPDNHNRAIAGQVLSRMAKSDPEGRLLGDFKKLFAVTRDERFVTARHTLQSLWMVGAASEALRKTYLEQMEKRFEECIVEKQCTLIRYDIITSLRNVYEAVGDEAIREKALDWIDREADEKYRKKYARVWKKS